MAQSSFLSAPAAQKRVKILAPLPLARAYDYAVPEGMTAAPGDYVRVSVGSRETLGVVWGEGGDDALDPKKIKSVLHKYGFPGLPEIHRQFIDKVARYTMSDLGSVLKMTLSAPDALEPPKAAEAYALNDSFPLSPRTSRAGEGRGEGGGDARANSANSALASPPPSPRPSPAHARRAHGGRGGEEVKLPPARQKILKLLSDGVPRRAADIAKETGAGAGVVRAMAKAGQLKTVAVEQPAPGDIVIIPEHGLKFSKAQQNAADALTAVVRQKKYAGVLLDGVTGSGKTEVYFEAVAETLKQGRQALVLLPEIALSTQFLERFQRRFGASPALWHSEVPEAKRRAVWAGVAAGKTKIVIGARSALFLPYADLGLIVVDEEHDASYKQEEGVLYHARDMAVLRANLSGIPAVLVSATPSLETVTNAKAGKYEYLHLPARHAGATMPGINVIDLKKTPPKRGKFLSPPLEQALTETLAAGEQSLLFLNRRGYAPLTLCRTCGYRFQCPSCTAWLVEHKKPHCLQCHHCGHTTPVPRLCPACMSPDSLAACGPGVERIQEEVKALLPDARTLVLASDMNGADAVASAVRQIENRKIDIIIGTQIVAKGHHFPALTLVGVVDADLGLAGGDLRAGERTFQLLHQVSGRAGRADKAGRVFLQTYMPDQAVIRALAANDRDRFIETESRAREQAAMPPFGRLAALILSSPDELELDRFCRTLAQSAPRYEDVRILGPAPAPLAFLRGKHRRRFLVKTGKNVALQKFLEEWLSGLKIPSAVRLKTDIDPQSFF